MASIRTLLPLSCLGLLAAPVSEAQETGVTASVSLQADGGFDSQDQIEPTAPVGVGPISLGSPASNVAGSATADFGRLESFANAQLVWTGDAETAPVTGAAALAEFRDTVTITSPTASDGILASLHYSVASDGIGFATNPAGFPAISGYMLSVQIGATNEIRTGFYVGSSLGGDPFGLYNGTAPITLGEPFLLQVQFIAEAMVGQPSAPGSYEAEMDLRSTLEWRGIPEVRDGMGTPIPFEVASESGVDWALPVPEPGERAAAIALLVGLSAAARWRTRTSRRF